jgi:carbon monoxide dehydrogenase subunit G
MIPGSVSATLVMQVAQVSSTEASLAVDTEIDMLGKLGDFGRPFIRKKTDQMMAAFTENLSKALQADS